MLAYWRSKSTESFPPQISYPNAAIVSNPIPLKTGATWSVANPAFLKSRSPLSVWRASAGPSNFKNRSLWRHVASPTLFRKSSSGSRADHPNYASSPPQGTSLTSRTSRTSRLASPVPFDLRRVLKIRSKMQWWQLLWWLQKNRETRVLIKTRLVSLTGIKKVWPTLSKDRQLRMPIMQKPKPSYWALWSQATPRGSMSSRSPKISSLFLAIIQRKSSRVSKCENATKRQMRDAWLGSTNVKKAYHSWPITVTKRTFLPL